MNQTVEALFDEGIKRYKDGESPDSLIPHFKQVCEGAPKNSSAWTCLSWLYLLAEKPNSALKAAQKAVKLSSQDPQARVNLAIAMLEVGKPGVRQHVDMAERVLAAVEELRVEVRQNLQEGLTRRPDWPSLQRVQDWLFG